MWPRSFKSAITVGAGFNVLLLFCSLFSHTQAKPLRSNVVLLLLDDVGYGDLDYGDGEHVSPSKTPHIAAFATGPNSVHFRRFYSGGAVCAPTRSSMVTGRTPTRECIINVEENALPLVLNQSTTAAYVRQAGYATGFFGKWHLGSLTSATSPDCQPAVNNACTPGYHLIGNLCCDGHDGGVSVLRPTDVGFDTALATPQVAPTATANCGCVGTVPGAGQGCELGHYAGPGHIPATQPWLECDQYFNSTSDGTAAMVSLPRVSPINDAAFLVDSFEAFARAAVGRGQPFFAQISFHNNHIPYVAPPEYRALYPGLDLNHQDYYGGLSVVDDQVQRVRALLQALGVANNTLVALTADNGPELDFADHHCVTFFNPGDNGGLTGRKRALTEGGIRVAGIVEFPPLVRAARVEPGYFPASTNDFLPTLLDIAGVSPHPAFPLDGVSLLPLLAGQTANRSTPIGWYSDFEWGLFPPERPVLHIVTCSSRDLQAPPSLPADFRVPFDQGQLAWTEGPMKLFACSSTPKVPASWRFALYNVVVDPREMQDLWPQLGNTVGDAMFQRFLVWQGSVEHSIAAETRCTIGKAM